MFNAPSPSRRLIALRHVAPAVALAWLFGRSPDAVLFLGPCYGDGGAPSATPGSAAARFCDGPADWLFMIPIVAGLIGGAIAVITKRVRWTWLAVVIGLAIEAVVVVRASNLSMK
jgi:hypothetical protein